MINLKKLFNRNVRLIPPKNSVISDLLFGDKINYGKQILN